MAKAREFISPASFEWKGTDEGWRKWRRDCAGALPAGDVALVPAASLPLPFPVRAEFLPLVSVDAEKRHDFVDLARVYTAEGGEGEQRIQWGFAMPRKLERWEALLRVEFKKPARCQVAIHFRLGTPAHEAALLSAFESDVVGLVLLTDADRANPDPLAVVPTLLLDGASGGGLDQGLTLREVAKLAAETLGDYAR